MQLVVNRNDGHPLPEDLLVYFLGDFGLFGRAKPTAGSNTRVIVRRARTKAHTGISGGDIVIFALVAQSSLKVGVEAALSSGVTMSCPLDPRNVGIFEIQGTSLSQGTKEISQAVARHGGPFTDSNGLEIFSSMGQLTKNPGPLGNIHFAHDRHIVIIFYILAETLTRGIIIGLPLVGRPTPLSRSSSQVMPQLVTSNQSERHRESQFCAGPIPQTS